VLNGVLKWSKEGATHVGVATNHVIESFRNDLWPGYKTSEGMEPALLAQFHPLEEALDAQATATPWSSLRRASIACGCMPSSRDSLHPAQEIVERRGWLRRWLRSAPLASCSRRFHEVARQSAHYAPRARTGQAPDRGCVLWATSRLLP
jgi:hypothetical protein